MPPFHFSCSLSNCFCQDTPCILLIAFILHVYVTVRCHVLHTLFSEQSILSCILFAANACCTLYVFHRQSISCVHLLRKRPLSVSVVNFSLPLLLLPSLVYLFAVVSTVFLLVFFDIGICLLCIPSAKIALASIKPPSNAFSSTQLNSSSTVLKIPAFR